MRKKVLIVVAHPDDETIWMGGTLLINANKWNITIISLCRKDDKDRAPKFEKVCKLFKMKCFMSNLEDDKLNDMPIDEVVKQIKKYSDKDYDYIFTHGENGEYGHKRHIDVNKAVIKMLKKKLLSAKKIFFFSYTKIRGLCYADKNSDKFIKLSNNLLKKKKNIIQDIYGFEKKSFEALCCRNTEAFKIHDAI